MVARPRQAPSKLGSLSKVCCRWSAERVVFGDLFDDFDGSSANSIVTYCHKLQKRETWETKMTKTPKDN